MTTAFQSNAFQNSGFQVDPVTGVLYAVDENDSGSFVGQVGISGSISVTDQNDSCNIQGTVAQPNNMDMHDGFTPEEIKRAKALDKKIAKLEAKKRQAMLDKRLARKKAISDLVSPPVVEIQQPEVELQSEVQVDKPSIDLKKVNANLIRLERQKQQLLHAVELRNQIAQAQMQLIILKAQQEAQDEEDSILALLL
jgi:hypothetical protein